MINKPPPTHFLQPPSSFPWDFAPIKPPPQFPHRTLTLDHRLPSTQRFTPKQMKRLMDQMRFKQKMEAIDRKKGKYKRSTNNCHKKYIGILKNLLFLKLLADPKQHILHDYNQYRNSRVYYFILLTHLKWHLEPQDIRWVYKHFTDEVQAKIARYRLQIDTTKNSNFIHFRKDEITEMEYSIQSVNYLLRNETEQAIRVLYQKNKYIIIKKNEYLRTLQIVKELETEMQRKFSHVDIRAKCEALNLEEICQWNREINLDIGREAREFDPKEQQDREEDARIYKQEERSFEEQEEEDDPQSEESLHKNDRIDSRYLVKHEESKEQKVQQRPQVEQEKKFPLLSLESSYRNITFMGWHSWQIQQHKKMEFAIRCREDYLKQRLSL